MRRTWRNRHRTCDGAFGKVVRASIVKEIQQAENLFGGLHMLIPIAGSETGGNWLHLMNPAKLQQQVDSVSALF